MNEEFKEDRAFLAGVRSALESDAEVDDRLLAALRLAALRERPGWTPAAPKTPVRTRAVLKVAASLLVLAGLVGALVRVSVRPTGVSTALRTIAFIGEADADGFGDSGSPEPLSGAEQLLALQDAPYYEAVANEVDFGDNSDIEF